jgi:hypothetical protein
MLTESTERGFCWRVTVVNLNIRKAAVPVGDTAVPERELNLVACRTFYQPCAKSFRVERRSWATEIARTF